MKMASTPREVLVIMTITPREVVVMSVKVTFTPCEVVVIMTITPCEVVVNVCQSDIHPLRGGCHDILHILKVFVQGGTPPAGSKCVECHDNHLAGDECHFDRHDNHLAGDDCHYDNRLAGGGCHFSFNFEFSLNYAIWIISRLPGWLHENEHVKAFWLPDCISFVAHSFFF